MAKWCQHDDNLIVWDEAKAAYICEACGRKKCPDCGVGLLFKDASAYCGRCDDKREQISMGIF